MPVYGIGLGSNVGERARNLSDAIAALRRREDLRVDHVSAVYETDAVGPPQPAFLNAAARITTALAPEALLDVLLAIEAALGRVRRERWGPRVIDLDILVWSGADLETPRVTVPHPRLFDRAFALVPLLDVDPPDRDRYRAAVGIASGRGATAFVRFVNACAGRAGSRNRCGSGSEALRCRLPGGLD